MTRLALPLGSWGGEQIIHARHAKVPDHIAGALMAALRAGEQVRGATSPNPPVGAGVFDQDGQVISVGGTQPAGGPHAEVVALAAAGEHARGAEMVVTLEPCNHHGRTGPCSEAIKRAGIQRVWFCQKDPGEAEGGGAQRLRDAGVEVRAIELPVLALEPWLAAQRLQRPYVVGKVAQTIDGFVAAHDGSSKWITGSAARQFSHDVRANVDAIWVGTGTVLADNPRLTARGENGRDLPHQPQPVVVGTRPLPAELALKAPWRFSNIDLAMQTSWQRGHRHVLVEGGPGLLTSMLRSDLVDELHIYTAPKLLGAGKKCVDMLGESIDAAKTFEMSRVQMLQPDTCTVLKRKNHDDVHRNC
ncbi:bifunctional diaminohydroxyphosphoribosylaminopyrimidine deaminase/5-amino-6-(5-phosphoribosylamino)uracil reductase RibD [Corynebacterium gerontici]|uniref:Riboflavin biosynthesis protein RibD n=1 Tax=Corynebacterium gerontici TaxID=2079234 RepID=A0A3G6J0P7_9CORY|nr:bifunctional diaminohydroxyphosphoribosylaminopyrimidine deaminase/5-amino-6-(5-phosphoribosylamino)uracil reductase RibD [Corynebacterium gerontici]AZA11496.1 Riboflavin biosynthesis protein RibD [Corynebacterium gerontici]